jgi:peptidoglycan/LPS O-acetylase OafA/YrhL
VRYTDAPSLGEAVNDSSHQAGPEPRHLPALDGVRGVAILLVLVYHFSWVLNLGTQWADRASNRVVGVGWTGVDLFFVLSGFLITRILLSAREHSRYFQTFYVRRVLRIFPLYYAFLFIMILLLPQLPGLRDNAGLQNLRHHQLIYWTYLYNVAISVHPLVDRGPYGSGHLWSLAVEEQFYLIWPVVVLLLGRRALAPFCVLCIVAAPVVRYGLLHGAVPDLHNVFAASTLMPARMDTLALGGLIAVIARDPELLRRAARWALPVGAAAILALAFLDLNRGGLPLLDEKVLVFGLSPIALAFGAFVAIVVGGAPGALQSVLGNRVLTFFGRYSYGLYVLHFQIFQELKTFAGDHGLVRTVEGSVIPFALAFTAVAMALSVSAAWLSWHLFEKQFLKLKRLVPYSSRSTGTTQSAPPSPGALQTESDGG